MSAITKFDISAHAEYRRSGYMSSRAQSRVRDQREWKQRERALRSWGEMLIPAVTAVS